MKTIEFEGRTRSLLNLSEGAQLFGVSKRSLWGLYAAGQIEAIKVGQRSLRFPVESLERYLQKQTVK